MAKKGRALFKKAERKKPLDKADYKKRIPAIRSDLLHIQQSLRKVDFPVLILFAGVDGAGKHETVDLLNEWMDPRGIVTRAYSAPSDEERERPSFWRFWRDMPRAGQIGLFLSAWYSRPLLDRVKGRMSDEAFTGQLARINALEQTLVDNGALILKFWMHLNNKNQKERLKNLAANPLTAWQVQPIDWQHWGLYDHFIDTSAAIIEATNTTAAPWEVVDGSDRRYRSLRVAEVLRDAIHQRVKSSKKKGGKKARSKKKNATSTWAAPSKGSGILATLDMMKQVSVQRYRHEMKQYQGRLYQLQRAAKKERISMVMVFQGWDAAGKGGAIRRLTQGLDARHYQVIAIAAPTDEEKAHHYLWRFWRHLPRGGRVTIFDRSWYGRVLVERVEGFAQPPEWQRAYDEINQFEAELAHHGIILCKFWMHITKDEQLRRFRERERIPYKSWKLTDEDWRNRKRWGEYEQAANDMISLTDTPFAPWTLVEGNQKYYARLKVIRTVCERLESALVHQGVPVQPAHLLDVTPL